MIKKQRHPVRLSCASSSASTRNARLFACSRALPHFSLSGYRFSLLYLHLFFLLALLSYFSRLSWFVFDRSRRYRLLFFFFLPFLVKWVSPRLREFYKKRGEARGARRETLFFFFYKYGDRVPCDRHRPRSLSKKNCSRTQRNGSRAAPTSSGSLSRRLRG